MEGVKFHTLRFINKHFKGFKEALVVIIAVYSLLILPKVADPILSQIYLDNILPGINPDWTAYFFLFCLLFLVFETVLRIIEAMNWKIQLRMTVNATTQLLWHTLHLPLSFFHDNFAGDVAAKMGHPSNVSNQIIQKLLRTISEAMITAVYLVFMIKYSFYLSIFAIIHIFLSIYILRRVNKRRVSVNKKMQKEMDLLQGFTSSSISNIEAIKGAGAEYGFFQRWCGHMTASQNAAISCSRQDLYLSVVPFVLTALANAAVLGIGVYYIIQGHLTIGMLMAFQGFMAGCLSSMKRLAGKFQVWANIKAKCEIMDGILSTPSEIEETIEDDTPFSEGKLKGYVELRDVTFGYDKNAGPLISNFNLSLQPGKSVAFVGQSGCGKSTLAKLISGLYSPWSGEVLFDGKKQSEINKRVFNNSVSIVDQNIVLFDGTIADNVKLWDKSIEDFAMIFACHDAQIHEEIASRNNSYDTEVENGGKNFSGGQRQRIEIASALAKEPIIMIMDEGTSALDAVTEERVMKAIKDMGISLIMIAHRLSTIRDCDEIIVLDKGKVVERGSHTELMDHKGLYSQLVSNN